MLPISVLVIDANQAFLQCVVQYLGEQQSASICVVGAASHETDALTLARALDPQVALVGMSGSIDSALRQITSLRRQLPEVAVVALSQLGAAGYAQAALAAGANFFVDKDQLRTDLMPAILQVAGAQNILRSSGPAVRGM